MKILLTNDDGYNAPGILALYETLRSLHDVLLIAPDREKSAVSHGITLNEPMRLDSVSLNGRDKGYAITGTPADCVKLGLFELYDTPPDLVISGINPGSNTGVNINYSGTIGAAREAALNGISSMAVSILKKGKPFDFKGMSQYVARLTNKMNDFKLPFGTFLNINAPNILIDNICGTKITRQDPHNVSKQFEKRTDPRNRPYFWYGKIDRVPSEADTDEAAISENYVSITPIQCDLTDYNSIAKLKNTQLI